MKLVHHGNACFSLFHQDLHFFFDPWLEGPAVAGGWTQFPPNVMKMDGIPKIDYIFISHIHSDHCELETMKKIDRKIPIILLERNPNFLKKYLQDLGFENLILVPAKTKKELPGFAVELFGESFGHLASDIIDSSLLLQFPDGKVVLNCNDNKPSVDLCHYIKDKYQKIDLALIPGGGGSGYPGMYENYSFEEKVQISRKIVDKYAEIFVEAVDILEPAVVIPVAGGFAIRGPEAEAVNWVQCRRLDHMELVEKYNTNSKNKKSRVLPMQPGMELDGDKGAYSKGKYHTWTENELKSYFKKLASEKVKPQIQLEKPLKNMASLVREARSRLWQRQEKSGMKPNYRIYLDINDHSQLIELDLGLNSSKELSKSDKNLMKSPYLRMRLDQNTLMEWLLGIEDFNMLDSGHRISFWREPIEKYEQQAYYLMSLLRLG
jgi:UDP-MurNAc hydroxylase